MKSLLSFFLVFWLVSCGSSKKLSTTAVNQTKTDTVQVVTTERTNTVTEHYGDTLKGSLPLPELTEQPISYVVSSGGASLKISIDKKNLYYESLAKQTGTTTISSDKTTKINTGNKVATVVEKKVKEVQKPWQPPLWWYPVGIALLIGAYYIIKNRLNPF